MRFPLLLAGIALYLVILVYNHPSEYGLIPPCQFHQWTGLFCPGCGATRAVHYLLRGDWRMSLHYNPLVLLSLPLILFFSVRSFYEMLHQRSFYFPQQAKLYLGLAIVMILFFALRNIPLAGFDILRPPFR